MASVAVLVDPGMCVYGFEVSEGDIVCEHFWRLSEVGSSISTV